MNTSFPRHVGIVLLLFLIPIHRPALADGVRPGNSTLISTLDYSDTFTGTEDGGRPARLYLPAVQAATAYAVENTYGNPQVNFESAVFSFAADKAGTPGLLDGSPPYPLGLVPDASGAGSATGFTQTGGSVDYGLPYNGLRSHFVVQVDAVQTGDRVDISCGAATGIFAAQSLSVFFRGDGSGDASLFNGVVDTPIQSVIPSFNTGITGSGRWYNYAVRFNLTAHEIELYVNQRSVGVINLATFANGLYNNFSAARVGAGAGLAGGENRVWTDNFQVGAPHDSCPKVTTIADSGPGSLRAAIECANNHPGLDTITFAIPGAGPHSIRPLTPLPIITDPVVLDGLTQPGAIPNSQPVGNNARLQIEIDGSLTATSSHGLVVNGGNSTLRGLVINGNDGTGIQLSSASNVVESCFIGTDTSGSAARPNYHGIWVRTSKFNQIGGASSSSRNVISGNRYSGIYVEGEASSHNRIQGNYLGADASGLNSLGNGTSLGNGAGVAISGGNFNLVGGPTPGEGNVISANRQSNLILVGHTNTVQGNYIGPDCTGTLSLTSGGGYYGLIVLSGTGNVIGGDSAEAGNVISGNVRGIDVLGPATLIVGNRIGTDVSGTRPLGNAVHGIMCYPPFAGGAGAFNSVLGGTNEGSGNIIAFNGADGIKVAGSNTPPYGVRILRNSIHDNLGLGIDLSRGELSDGARGDGPTPNDLGDPDDGPNRLQNHPILNSANLVGGYVVLEGRLNSEANRQYRIEFFANAAPDPSGYGEGEVFLGFATITTDAAGNAPFTVSLPAVAAKLHYTATATDLDGNTSEFSPAIQSTAGAPIACLWNTGVDSSGIPRPDDAPELHYLLVQNGFVRSTPFVARASGGFPILPWLGDNDRSAWIAPTADTQSDGSVVYVYETLFDLTGFAPSSVVIAGRWSTDNEGRDILINGVSTAQENTAQFGAWTPFHIRGGFVAGLNRLTFLVSNAEGAPNPFGPTGLRVEMSGTGTLHQRLSIARRDAQVVVRWQGAGFMLQAADDMAGPWADFSAGTSVDAVTFEVSLQPNARVKFFRLRLEQACAAASARLRANSTVPVVEERTEGIVRFLSFNVPWNPAAIPTQRALDFLNEYSDVFGFKNPTGQFRASRTVNDALGSHIFFSQHQGPLDVVGGEIAVHLTDGAIVGVNGAYLQRIPEGMVPTIDSQGAMAAAMASGNAEAAASILGVPLLVLFNASLWMSSLELSVRGLDMETHLAWQLSVVQHDGRHALHFIDASTGDALARIALDKTQAAMPDISVATALNSQEDWAICGFLRQPIFWFDESGPIAGAAPAPDPEGFDAFAFIRQTYNFFFNSFGRRSWDGNEGRSALMLDVGNLRLNAAFIPACNELAFGDGMVTRDVVAHEYTHGVTETTAKLIYLNQSGALNESYSDVMAAMIDPANWTIGEGSSAGTFRDMENPHRFSACNSIAADCVGHPDHMDEYRNITWDQGGVHINSGIPNRAAVLVADGGTHHGMAVRGLGRTKTARLYYDVLTTKLTQSSRFIDAAAATVEQASEYAARGLYSFSDEDVCEVAKAFAAVGLLAPNAGDLSPAQFIELRAVYQRVSDNLETGAEIIPSSGFLREHIATDRRIVLAITAADNESGVASITMEGESSVECHSGSPSQGDVFHSDSDEVRAGTAAPGHPVIRTAHFTINPTWLSCSGPVASASVTIRIKNGNNCVSRSGQITFTWGL